MLIILMFTEPLLPSSPTQDTGKKLLRNGIIGLQLTGDLILEI